MAIIPLLAAGRGWRAMRAAIAVELIVVSLIVFASFSSVLESLEHWRTDGLFLLPFVGLFVLPMLMSGIVLFVKHKEENDDRPGKFCRVCGYDLRATPDRCPECGTPVKQNPDLF
jgi:hypothetical protein